MREYYSLPSIHCEECGVPVDFTWDDDKDKTGYKCSCGHFEPAEDLDEFALEWQISRQVTDRRKVYKARR